MTFQSDIKKQEIYLDDWKINAATVSRVQATVYEKKMQHYYDLLDFLVAWFSDTPDMPVQTSGSTGHPKRLRVMKEAMLHSACRTCRFLNLKAGESMLLCMNLKYIGAQMMVVRALAAGMRLVVCEPSAHPLARLKQRIDFLSMVPMQLASSLQSEQERSMLQAARVVIVGGGAIDETLEKNLQSLSCRVYSTYGMTETLSHIAMRPLNGAGKSARYFPLPGVQVSLSKRETLIISVPDVCAETLETNDRVQLYPDGSFEVCGRIDNVINSGGVKIQIEEDERLLCAVLPFPYALTAVPDALYGEHVVLLAETVPPNNEVLVQQWLTAMAKALPRYHAPKEIVFVTRLPRTENGKIDRKRCREIAAGK